MLASALAVAFYYVWSVELTERYGTVVVAAWSTVFGDGIGPLFIAGVALILAGLAMTIRVRG